LADELIPGNILKDFGDANWKVRLAALEEATTWLEGITHDVDAEVVVRAFAQKGWSEKNFQVSYISPIDYFLQLSTHRFQRNYTQ
jgi:cytoskeleton-associated protein 5